jgi:hypothetical protein
LAVGEGGGGGGEELEEGCEEEEGVHCDENWESKAEKIIFGLCGSEEGGNNF